MDVENNLYLEDRIIIIETSRNIIEKIKEYFTYSDTSEAMTGFGFNKDKVKHICFVHKKGKFHWIKSGLAKQLVLFIKKNGWKFNIKQDLRNKININIPNDKEIENILPGISLYDYQINAVKKLLKSKVGICKAVTSAGKSIIMAAIMKVIDKPFLLLVNKKSLANQLWKDLNEFGIDCGVCHSEKKIFKESMVCTIGSVGRIKDLSKIKVLLIDEVHRAASDTFQNFLKNFIPTIRIGFSATPAGGGKYNFALIRQYFGEIEITITAKELLTKHKIAKPHIYFVNNIVNPEVNWTITEKKQLIYNEIRNGLIANFVNQYNDICFLILVNKKDHGRILQEKIPGSIYLDGGDKVKYREEIKDKMESGEIKKVITTGIFNEGISIKAIQVLINASARKSIIETLQKLGRALRIKEDKQDSILIDFQDRGNNFLFNQYKQRRNTYKKEGFDEINEVFDVDLNNLNIKEILKCNA